MKNSANRILTTHTGALYRPRDLEEMLKAKVNGQPYDEAALEARLTTAVAEVVREQAAHGVDIVNDGEFSKPQWAYYVHERLGGIEYRDTSEDVVPISFGKDCDRLRRLLPAVRPALLPRGLGDQRHAATSRPSPSSPVR